MCCYRFYASHPAGEAKIADFVPKKLPLGRGNLKQSVPGGPLIMVKKTIGFSAFLDSSCQSAGKYGINVIVAFSHILVFRCAGSLRFLIERGRAKS